MLPVGQVAQYESDEGLTIKLQVGQHTGARTGPRDTIKFHFIFASCRKLILFCPTLVLPRRATSAEIRNHSFCSILLSYLFYRTNTRSVISKIVPLLCSFAAASYCVLIIIVHVID